MKTVGKQLQEARLAKNWTPELAARETKIKVDRLRDLEVDDYSHFTSPTYARGFVRTYARALGLDEYRILRQLDNKLPDDDSANIVTDTGVAYLPETALPPRVAHRDYTGLYIVMALGGMVTLAIVFVLFEAYRVGELSRYFASSPEPAIAAATTGTNTSGTPASPGGETIARALPIDSNTPPPIVEASNETTETNATHTPTPEVASAASPPGLTSPRALPVDASVLPAGTNAAPGTDAPIQAVRALPVDPFDLTNAAPDPNGTTPVAANITPPRALPVSPDDLAAVASSHAPPATTLVAVNTVTQAPPPAMANGTDGTNAVSAPAVVTPAPAPRPAGSTPSARQSDGGPVMEPSLPAIAPSPESIPAAPVAFEAATNTAPQTAAISAEADKRLILTASQDSFVRVTNLDSPADKQLYADVLRSGQSVGFDGRKFSINVGVPSAVDIKLDGVNYGPHSDQETPETFTVQSHQP